MRTLTGLSYHSGEDQPPMFGDYECHRHWMEITYHYPPTMWYANGPHMNMTYWPMDYPPLCAYTHWLMAQIVGKVQPDAVKLQGSYGYNSPGYRSLMHGALILIELLVMVPAVIKLLALLYPKHTTMTRRIYLTLYLLMPPLVYVDHGHFQPNSPMHGLVLWATYHILVGRTELAVVLMVMAANFKQMGLYFGLPFAFYALSTFTQIAGARYKASKFKQVQYLITRIIVLGAIFVITLGLLWYPWVKESIRDPASQNGLKGLLERIFPTHRGLF